MAGVLQPGANFGFRVLGKAPHFDAASDSSVRMLPSQNEAYPWVYPVVDQKRREIDICVGCGSRRAILGHTVQRQHTGQAERKHGTLPPEGPLCLRQPGFNQRHRKDGQGQDIASDIPLLVKP